MINQIIIGDRVQHYHYGKGVVVRLVAQGIAEVKFGNSIQYVQLGSLTSSDPKEREEKAKREKARKEKEWQQNVGLRDRVYNLLNHGNYAQADQLYREQCAKWWSQDDYESVKVRAEREKEAAERRRLEEEQQRAAGIKEEIKLRLAQHDFEGAKKLQLGIASFYANEEFEMDAKPFRDENEAQRCKNEQLEKFRSRLKQLFFNDIDEADAFYDSFSDPLLNREEYETEKSRFIHAWLDSAAIAIDLETDGEVIWQIGVAAGDSSETIYGSRNNGDITLPKALSTLEERASSRKLLVGHNVLAWDIPILQKHMPGLGKPPLVWDTLLVSYLLAPWQASHSLDGTHDAAADAKDAYSLFLKQAHQLGAQSVIGLIRKPPTNGAGLIGAVAGLLEGKPFEPSAPPGWFAALTEHHLPDQQRQRVVVPHTLLNQVAWIKDVTVSATGTDATSEIDYRVVDAKRFSEAAAVLAPTDPHASVLASVLERAEQHSIEVRLGMIPQWLKDVPVINECFSNSSVVNNAGGIVFSAYPRTAIWYSSDEAKDTVFLFPPRAGLVTDDSWNARMHLSGFLAQELDKEPLNTSALYRVGGDSNEDQGAQWIFFDPVRHRLNPAGRCYRSFKTLPAGLLPSERIVAQTYKMTKPVLVDWGTRTYLRPTTQDQRAYWCEVLERAKSIALAKAGTVVLLLIASSDEPKLRELVEDGLVALGLTHERRSHWSRLERLRRAATHEGKRCIVDFVNHLPEWNRLGNSSGIRISPVIEAVPLHEWKALMDFVLNADQDADLPTETTAQDEEGSEEPVDVDVGEDDVSDLIANGHKREHSHLQRVPLTVSASDTKSLVDSCLDDWLLSIGCNENLESYVIDPRLPPRILGQSFRTVSVPPASLTDYERELVEIALDDIGDIKREIPTDDYESLRAFLEAHWGYPDFYDETQKPAIEVIRARDKDVLVVLPTGIGKSVLFQVPALYRGLKTRRLTVVISPLRALMRDQVSDLQDKRGFHQSVDYLSADRPVHELEDVYQGILDHRIVLLYIAPERFRNRRFLDILGRRYQQDGAFEFVVIDETHCVSQWGYEFRPDYFHALKIIRERYRKPDKHEKTPFLLFSATIMANVRDDLERLICHDSGEPYLPFAVIRPGDHMSPIRSHIQIKTKSVLGSLAGRNPRDWDLEPRFEVIVAQVREAVGVKNKTGQISSVIVFVSRRVQAEELALQLAAAELGVVDYFHAGLDRETREDVYARYKEGYIDVLVATKAFGMGMDIPHIQWAIHLSPPSYLEDYLQEVGRIGRGENERKKAELDQLISVLLYSADDFQANHANVQRSRVDFPQLKDLWNQISKNAQPREDGWIALMPDSGFDQHVTSWEIRSAANRVRNCLFWLEKMKRVAIIQMMPGLLQMTLHPVRLKQLASEDDSDTSRIAACLSKLAEGDQETAPKTTTELTHGGVNSGETRNEGWVDRIISGISGFFGFRLGGNGGNTHPERPVTLGEHATERKSQTPLREIDVVVNVDQLWRETTYRSSSEVLAVLVKLQRLGGLKIPRKLFFGQSALGKRLNTEQIRMLITEVEKVASDLIRQIDSRRDVELDFEAAGLSLQVTDSEGKPIEVRHVIEKSTALVLRLTGAHVLEKILPIEGRGQRMLVATLSAGKAGRAIQRSRELCQLAIKIWEQVGSHIADGESSLALETLVRITVDVQGRFHERALRQALNLLASLHLAICSEPLLPLSYVLEVRDKGQPLDEQDHPKVMVELTHVNRLAEIRSHAMEVYANLPEEARERFITGYFEVRKAEDLEKFLEGQLKEIGDDGSSGFVQQKLAQIRAEEIGKLFERYRDPQAPEPNQWKAIRHPYEQHLLVNAGPGAGKTSVLIARVAHLIHEQRLRPEQILVLAFNRAVVFEIRAWIRKLFHDLGYGAYVRHLRVLTFHALATKYVGRVENDENVLAKFAELLEGDARVAREAAEGIRAIMVDEFQDVDKHIFKIIEVLQRTSGAGVLAIGDDDQDILRWNRIKGKESGERTSATWYFREIERLLGISQDSRLALKVNFRSGPAIVHRSENLLDKFFGDDAAEKRLKHGIPLAPAAENPKEQIDDLSGPESWGRTLLKAQELLKEVAGAKKGTVAVLCRTNGEVAQVYNQLKETFPELGIQTSYVYPLSRLRHIACWLELCQKIHDSEKNPSLGNGVRAMMEKAWKGLVIPEVAISSPDVISPWDLWELIHKEHSYPRISDLIDFVNDTKTDECFRMIGKTGNSGSAVVSTIHKVKGLEFDAVALCPSRIGFPFGSDQDMPSAAAEEARLFYVGMTRAKSRLVFGFGEREQA